MMIYLLPNSIYTKLSRLSRFTWCSLTGWWEKPRLKAPLLHSLTTLLTSKCGNSQDVVCLQVKSVDGGKCDWLVMEFLNEKGKVLAVFPSRTGPSQQEEHGRPALAKGSKWATGAVADRIKSTCKSPTHSRWSWRPIELAGGVLGRDAQPAQDLLEERAEGTLPAMGSWGSRIWRRGGRRRTSVSKH